jgi:hypothetical protein
MVGAAEGRTGRLREVSIRRMTRRTIGGCFFAVILSSTIFSGVLSHAAFAQVLDSNTMERAFPQSKAAIEQTLKSMQAPTSGRLPVLEGFANSPDRPLARYQRGYYQSTIQVVSAPSGGSIVRVSVEVTAWYNDPIPSHSGYKVLPSNGRLEADILDQLSDQLAGSPAQPSANPSRNGQTQETPTLAATPRSGQPAPIYSQPAPTPKSAPAPIETANSAPPPSASSDRTEPNISAPMPRLPESSGGLSSAISQNSSDQTQPGPKKNSPDQNALQAEVDSLEEILKNQAHPNNLAAVKKSGTPVVEGASLNAKTLFLASAHDEFEILDFNRDWVHVRVSGLSRGWIWRDNLEMPSGIPDNDLQPAVNSEPVAADLFHVTREEKAVFPGDWTPLRGKTVKIVSVEKVKDDEKGTGPRLRLEFAKSVMDKDYVDLSQKAQELGGIVLIFDSADGGMIAATLPTLQQWKAGTLSDAALWHQCFFDPPESFIASSATASP